MNDARIDAQDIPIAALANGLEKDRLTALQNLMGVVRFNTRLDLDTAAIAGVNFALNNLKDAYQANEANRANPNLVGCRG